VVPQAYCTKGNRMISPIYLGFIILFAIFGLAHIVGRFVA
jgi:hypothetical protein